jgi:hypothetical protein
VPPIVPAKRRTAGGWYLVGVGLVGIGIAIALTGFSQMIGTIEGMQRVVMPGTAPIVLSAGRTTFYFETRAPVNGRVVEAASGANPTCTLISADDTQIPLEPYAGTLQYTLGGYSGRAIYDAQLPAGGSAKLRCELGVSGEGVIAIGGGIGAWIVVGIVGGMIPALGGIALLIVVFVKRRRWDHSHPG